MKKLAKSTKIVLISVVSFVCVLAIVLGCVFGLKPKKPAPLTEAQLLAKSINENVKKPSLEASNSKAFESKCDIDDVEEITSNFFVFENSGKKYFYLYKKNADGTYEYKNLTDTVENGGFVENDAESYTIEKYNDNFVVISSNYAFGEDETFTNKIVKLVSVSNYENPVVIYELNLKNKNAYLDSSNVFVEESYFSLYYLKDFDTKNPNKAKVDIVLGKLSDSVLSEEDVVTVTDKEIYIFTNSMDFSAYNSYVYAKFNNENLLFFVSDNKPMVYSKFANSDDVSYTFSEINKNSILVEKKSILRDETKKTANSIIEDPNIVNYDYSILKFDSKLQLKPLKLDNGYSKATTVYLEDFGYYYICEQKSQENVMQDAYKSLYLNSDLEVVLKYESSLNENVLYAKDKFFVTSSKLINENGKSDKVFEPFAQTVADKEETVYTIGQADIYQEQFVVYTTDGYGLMKYDGSIILDPAKSKLAYIYPVYGKYVIGRNFDDEYYLIKTSDGSKTKIEDFCTFEWVLNLAKYGFAGYVTVNEDSVVKILSFDGKILFEKVNGDYGKSLESGGILKLSSVSGNNFFVQINSNYSIDFSKSKSTSVETPNVSDEIAVAEPYYSTEMDIVSSDGYNVGVATYSGSDPVNITITMDPGYYIPAISFNFTFWNSYIISFSSNCGVDGKLSATDSWSVSLKSNNYGNWYVYSKSHPNSALFDRVRGFDSDTCKLSYSEETLQNCYTLKDSYKDTNTISKVWKYYSFDYGTRTGYELDSINVSGMDNGTHTFTFYSDYSYPKQTKNASESNLYPYNVYKALRWTPGTVTVSYNWVGLNYTITYKANGATGDDKTQTVTFGSTFTTLSSSTYSIYGYKLSSWNTNSGGTQITYNCSTSYTWGTSMDITLYAIWTPNVYYVDVDVNGGVMPSGVTKRTIGQDEAFEIYDKSLSKYYYKTNSTEAYHGRYWNSDVTSGDSNSVVLVSTSQAGVYYYTMVGTSKTTYTTPTGNLTYKGTKYYYVSITPSSYGYINTTKTEKYTSYLGTLTTEAAVKKLIDTYYIDVNYGAWFYVIPPTRTGYEFDGYYGYMVHNGTVHDNEPYQYGESATSYESSTSTSIRTSATQNYFKNLKKTVYNPEYGSAYLTAQWNPISYKLSYDYDGGAISGTNPTSATYDVVFNLEKPIRFGYTFDGWTISGADTTEHRYGSSATSLLGTSSFASFSVGASYTYFKNLTSVKNATVTIKAKWKANTYNIDYNANGGSFGSGLYGTTSSSGAFIGQVYSPVILGTNTYRLYKYNNTATTIYSKAYYTGAGSAYYGIILVSTSSQGVYYLYQTQSGGSYKSVTTVGGSFNYNGKTYYYSSPAYSFLPSYCEISTSSNTTTVSGTTVSDVALALVKLYLGASYKVGYNYNTEYSFKSISRTGYTLNSLTLSNMENGVTHTFGSLTNDLTSFTLDAAYTKFKNLRGTSGTVSAVANWRANTYNITYNLNGGSWGDGAVHPTSATYDTAFQVTNPATAPQGYSFSGWVITGASGTWYYGTSATSLPNSKSTGAAETTTISKQYTYFKNLTYTNGGNVSFIASFSSNKYNVAFEPNGTGVTINNSTIEANFDSPFMVNNPMRIGYTFTGWALTGLSDDITHTYIIGLKSYDDTTKTFESTNGAYVNPTNPNLYILVKSEYGGYVRFVNLHYIAGETVTLTANWSPNDYTITYHYALNSNFSGFPNATTVNTISNMTNTKTQTVTFDQYFTPLANARYDGQENAVGVPTGYLISSWKIVINGTLTGTTTANSNYNVSLGEIMFDYKFYTDHSKNSIQITSINAYPIYSSVSITIKYFDAKNEDGFNKMGEYKNTSTAKINYGASLTIPNSSYDAFVGYMISPNMYSAGDVAKEASVTSYVFDSVTYSAEPGNTIKWGISNTNAYNSDDPVFYLYAVYSTSFTGKTTIRNNTESNMYVTVTATNSYKFSYGQRVYDKLKIDGCENKYLLVQPGQVLVVYEDSSSSSVTKYTYKPDDLVSEGFFAAYGEYPQTYVGDSLNSILKNATLTSNRNKYTTMVGTTEVTLQGYTYNGVEYAKLDSSKPSQVSLKFLNDETIGTNQTYFFYVEPILSVFVEKKDFGSYVFRTIDSMGSMNFCTDANLSANEGYLWKNSDIRTYLNNKFYVESSLGAIVEPTKVWNNAYGNYNDGSGDSSIDNIWLMSAEEIVRAKDLSWAVAKRYMIRDYQYTDISFELGVSDFSRATLTSMYNEAMPNFWFRTLGYDLSDESARYICSSDISYIYTNKYTPVENTLAYYPAFAVNLDGIELPDAKDQPERGVGNSSIVTANSYDDNYTYVTINNESSDGSVYIRVKDYNNLSYTFSGAYNLDYSDATMNSVWKSTYNSQLFIINADTVCRFRIPKDEDYTRYIEIYNDLVSYENVYGPMLDSRTYSDSPIATFGAYPQTFTGIEVSGNLANIYENENSMFEETGHIYYFYFNGTQFELNEYYYYDTYTNQIDYTRKIVAFDLDEYENQYFSPYSTDYTFSTADETYILDAINQFRDNYGYHYIFFFVEPIEFYVIGIDEESPNSYKLLQSKIIGNALNNGSSTPINSQWESSDLRSYLNDDSSSEGFMYSNNLVNYTWDALEVLNNTSNNPSDKTDGSTTSDNIWLPSVWEIYSYYTNGEDLDERSSFFNGNAGVDCETNMDISDFAKFIGVRQGSFLTRSLSNHYSNGIYVVTENRLSGDRTDNIIDTDNVMLSQYGIIIATAYTFI